MRKKERAAATCSIPFNVIIKSQSHRLAHKRGSGPERKPLGPSNLFLVADSVAVHELVDATGCIDELLLAGEEGVRRAGDFKLYQRIGYAVNLDGLAGCHCGACDEGLVIRHVLEHYFTIA